MKLSEFLKLVDGLPPETEIKYENYHMDGLSITDIKIVDESYSEYTGHPLIPTGKKIIMIVVPEGDDDL